MASIWKTLEKHLINVEKPARYIGLEQGVQYPEHDESKVAWLLTYPDTYEVGFPNQGQDLLDAVSSKTRSARQ